MAMGGGGKLFKLFYTFPPLTNQPLTPFHNLRHFCVAVETLSLDFDLIPHVNESDSTFIEILKFFFSSDEGISKKFFVHFYRSQV